MRFDSLRSLNDRMGRSSLNDRMATGRFVSLRSLNGWGRAR